MGEMATVKETLKRIVASIQNNVAVQKIYLFGSYSDDTYTDDSDLDLCIITSLDGTRKIDVLRQIRKAILHDVDMPVDLLVYDQDEFEQRSSLTTTMEHKIARDGVLLHG